MPSIAHECPELPKVQVTRSFNPQVLGSSPSGSFRPFLIVGLVSPGGVVFSGGAGVLPNSL
jgi:hypothetical protein